MHLIPLRQVLQLSSVIIWQNGDDTYAREWLESSRTNENPSNFCTCVYISKTMILIIFVASRILLLCANEIHMDEHLCLCIIGLKAENTQVS